MSPMGSHMRVNFFKPWTFVLVALTIGACSGGAVTFAPTPPPPDTSPALYTHPSGAFTVMVPRQWGRYEQNTTTLASASFSAPGADSPAMTIAAIRLDSESGAIDLGALLDRYQAQVRPDTQTYKEAARAAMGDGSWRLDGLRRGADGREEAVNTFVGRTGDVVGVIEIGAIDRLSAAALLALEALVDSARFDAAVVLDPAPLTTLTFVKTGDLALLHVMGWHTPSGAFYLTGEVGNYGALPLTDLTVEAGLFDGAGVGVAGASDVVMGYALLPGGFAPFSLRFGEGQAARAVDYVVQLGAGVAAADSTVGAESLTWTDSAGYDALGRLVIAGQVTNSGSRAVLTPRALATAFDGAENVIGAAWVDVAARIVPGATVDFSITLGDLGGEAQNYLVTVQGVAP